MLSPPAGAFGEAEAPNPLTLITLENSQGIRYEGNTMGLRGSPLAGEDIEAAATSFFSDGSAHESGAEKCGGRRLLHHGQEGKPVIAWQRRRSGYRLTSPAWSRAMKLHRAFAFHH
jgi:hypothetical protein